MKQGQSQPVKSSPLSEGDTAIADFLGMSSLGNKLVLRADYITFEPDVIMYECNVLSNNEKHVIIDEEFKDVFKPLDSKEVRVRRLDQFISTAKKIRSCHVCSAIIRPGEKHLRAGGAQVYSNLCAECVKDISELLDTARPEEVDESFEDTFQPIDPGILDKRVADNKKLIQQKIDKYGYVNVPEFKELIELLNKYGYYASGSIQTKEGLLDLLTLLVNSKDKEVSKYHAGIARIFVRKLLPKDK